MFIVLANDGWSLIYLNHFRAVSGFKSTLFFISLLGFGQLILLNIFLAILVSNFDEDSFNSSVIQGEINKLKVHKDSKLKRFMKMLSAIPEKICVCCKRKNKITSELDLESQQPEEQTKADVSLFIFKHESTFR